MQIVMFVGNNNLFYILTKSNLNHSYHPRLKSEAILWGQPEGGTFIPKRVYDMNQKTKELHDFATGLFPDSNDAQ
jgi:hypothetical protein